MINMGVIIEAARRAYGEKQFAFGQDYNLTQSHVSLMERNLRNVPPKLVESMAVQNGVHPADLLLIPFLTDESLRSALNAPTPSAQWLLQIAGRYGSLSDLDGEDRICKAYCAEIFRPPQRLSAAC